MNLRETMELLHRGGSVPLNVVEAVNELLEQMQEDGTLIEQQGKEMIRLQQLANKQSEELQEAKKDISHYSSIGAEFAEENERLRKELEEKEVIIRAVRRIAHQPIGVFGEDFGWEFHYNSIKNGLKKVVGQEGEGNQRTIEVTLINEGYKEHQLTFDDEG